MRISVAALLALSGIAAPAQTFDVASVRESAPDARGQSIDTQPASLNIRNVSLLRCITWAWHVQPFQVSGPSWLEEPRFDIAARAAERTDDDGLRLMLRALLAERFGLKLRVEKKEMAVYSLIVGKNGPNFHEPTAKDSSKFLESKSQGAPVLGNDKTGLTAERTPLWEIAERLSEPLQRPVIDKTGLQGRYDIRLDVAAWMTSPEGNAGGRGQLDPIAFIFSGFQSQLGLKLESGKDAVDYLVIESVNKTPTQN
jgi:uncharacterized protein (TIGR03435 family)